MKALLVTFDKCPNLDAGAVRIHMLAKMLVQYGYEVTVISMGPSTNFKPICDEEIYYTSFRANGNTVISKAISYLLFSIRLGLILRQARYDVIIHTQIDKASLDVLIQYSNKLHIPIIYDSVEWFSPEQFIKGTKSKAYILNDNYNTKYISRPHKVISISRYLYNHFQGRNIKTTRIPAVLDVHMVPYEKKKNHGVVNIIYAGAPGKKDYLDVVVKAISTLSEQERVRLKIIIIGCDKNTFMNNTTVSRTDFDRISNYIDFRGRILRSEVLSSYSEADFSILIRSSNSRYAKAGFPTKLVESLATGTPVICNYTSDIADYIEDMRNGVVVYDESVSSCIAALQKVLALNEDDISEMQASARKLAEGFFDYRKYSKQLIDLIEE